MCSSIRDVKSRLLAVPFWIVERAREIAERWIVDEKTGAKKLERTSGATLTTLFHGESFHLVHLTTAQAKDAIFV